MLLAKCRPFAGDIKEARQPVACDIKELEASFNEDHLILVGQVEALPPAFGLVAYNDSSNIPGDYDATGWIAKVDSAGRFRLSVGELQPGPYELRLQVCHLNGAASRFSFQYKVNSLGVPDLKPFAPSVFLLQRAVRAYAQGDSKQVEALTAKLEKESSEDLARQARHLRALLQPRAPQALAAVPADQKQVSVSGLQFAEESVGWGRPLRDQVLVEDASSCFLQVDGQYYDRGLFAHAASKYVLDVQGQWKWYTSSYGLQDGHPGSVVFVVLGDGRELFRSERITGHRPRSMDLDITGVKRLGLVVEDAGDGASFDWGVWISPTLRR